jgi:hypothetical protein
MASRKKDGLGRGLNEIIAERASMSGRETGGLSSMYNGPYAEGSYATEVSRPAGGYRNPNIFDPAQGPPKPWKKPKPGIAPEALDRIRQDLNSIKYSPASRDEMDGGEPPDAGWYEDTEEEEPLPAPEYIESILQADRPAEMDSDEARFAVVRPDLDKRFYGQGSERSTRVHAMQWIPTHRSEYGTVFGDIFVAFARPSKGKSALFVYTDKSEETWENFKSNPSLGSAVNGLGAPEDQAKMTEDLYNFYESKHLMHMRWIFREPDKWRRIRPNNSIAGDEAKTAAEATATIGESPKLAAIKARRERKGK